MRIEYKDNIYHLHEGCKINFLVDNQNKIQFITCLQEYFGKKKKNYCRVYTEEKEYLLCDEIEFVYVPFHLATLENNLMLKEKSMLNIELSHILEENPKEFQTLEYIRQQIHELLTDRGFFLVYNILTRGMTCKIDIKLDEFDVRNIISMLYIQQEHITEEEKLMMIYNMILFLKKEKPCIVYIDIPISNQLLKWMKSWENKGILFLLNNDIDKIDISLIEECSIIKLSNQNFIEKCYYQMLEFPLISYSLMPIVEKNLELQTEKIIDYYDQFKDNSQTFYINFYDTVYEKSY